MGFTVPRFIRRTIAGVLVATAVSVTAGLAPAQRGPGQLLPVHEAALVGTTRGLTRNPARLL